VLLLLFLLLKAAAEEEEEEEATEETAEGKMPSIRKGGTPSPRKEPKEMIVRPG
jgi:hypothetical protein